MYIAKVTWLGEISGNPRVDDLGCFYTEREAMEACANAAQDELGTEVFWMPRTDEGRFGAVGLGESAVCSVVSVDPA